MRSQEHFPAVVLQFCAPGCLLTPPEQFSQAKRVIAISGFNLNKGKVLVLPVEAPGPLSTEQGSAVHSSRTHKNILHSQFPWNEWLLLNP